MRWNKQLRPEIKFLAIQQLQSSSSKTTNHQGDSPHSAPASSSAKSPDSPHNTVFTPECSHVSTDFLAKSLGHHDSELNYTLCTHFSHLNQQIMACVQLGISSWKGGTQAAPIGDQIQGCSFKQNSAGKGQARENKFIYCK